MSEPERSSAASPGAGSTSRSLLRRLKKDDAAAWDRLVTLYAPLVRHWCRRFDLPERDVPDVVQDVFGAVSRKIVDFRKERPADTFRGWMRTITRNKTRDYFRLTAGRPTAVGGTEANLRLAQFPDDPGDDEIEEPEQGDRQAEHELLLRALEQIRGEFHERTWQAFWRVTVDGQTAAEAGEEMSMRPGTVRVAKSRVLRRLREELGELLD